MYLRIWFLVWGLFFFPVLAAADIGPILNELRAQKGLVPLSASAKLTTAARKHAQDMARRGFFSHEGSNGSSVGDRVRRQGGGFCFVAENIAKGQGSLQEVVADWMASAGHRKNMLNRKAAEYGLARASGNIWVLVLGRSGC